jgi:hypothetical protein
LAQSTVSAVEIGKSSPELITIQRDVDGLWRVNPQTLSCRMQSCPLIPDSNVFCFCCKQMVALNTKQKLQAEFETEQLLFSFMFENLAGFGIASADLRAQLRISLMRKISMQIRSQQTR